MPDRSPSLRGRSAAMALASASAIAFLSAIAAVGIASVGAGPAGAGAIGNSSITGPQVELNDLKFKPNKLDVKIGDTVTFVWKEKVTHNVVFQDDKKKYKSKLTNKGVYTRKFDKAGTYKYVCTIHPGMKGELTVK